MKKNIRLPNGVMLDNLGIGTWYMGDDATVRKEEIAAIRYALDNGVSIIDTAEMYGSGKSELLLGEAIKPYDRSKLFVISKVLPNNAGRDRIFNSCENSLKRLGTDYLDMYLLHWRGSVPFEETIDAMEELKDLGKIKSWGVSNMDIEEMEEILNVSMGENCCANEVLYHLGSRGIEYSLKKFTDKHNVPTIAYCPLAQGGLLRGNLLKSSSVLSISKKYSISPMQVLLLFTLNQDNVISIPKSANIEHMKELVACLELSLDNEDIILLNKEHPSPIRKEPLDIE
ncbi:aldo/keto reductase [Fusobacterium sp. PH5-44]|uniref:aldo/keto reductase n=1 Tax=unclassified Fusobacterium TaxID=2648384 RepID=UPI003D1BB8F5